ncbi:hypothetical protein NQU54_04445, partial [Streptomyces samsunensis]|nr:hypothetical protein [Streptomyces samsunensis]
MNRTDSAETAADLAAEAALLEIAEELGLSDLLDRAEPFTLRQATDLAAVPAPGAAAYLGALVSAGLVEQAAQDGPDTPRADLADRRS